MTPNQVRELLKSACDKAGSQSAFADKHGMSRALICQIINNNLEPANKVCAALGIERVITYRKIRTDGE